MLSREDNELVTRVGPGTPLGRMMRKYWTPALLSEEIARDGAPVRIRLLGERLVAFRDTDGRVGVFEEYCPHRRVSLFLGRNEERGLRCVYHGWKFDVAGRCVDMPTEPPGSEFQRKMRAVAYPTVEHGGVVWAYLGSGEPPAPPRFEWTRLRPEQRVVTRTWQECNWLQALEGGIDAAHAAALHTVIDEASKRAVGGVRHHRRDRAAAKPSPGAAAAHRRRPRPAGGGRPAAVQPAGGLLGGARAAVRGGRRDAARAPRPPHPRVRLGHDVRRRARDPARRRLVLAGERSAARRRELGCLSAGGALSAASPPPLP